MKKFLLLVILVQFCIGLFSETRKEKRITLTNQAVGTLESAEKWIVENIVEFNYSVKKPQKRIDSKLREFHVDKSGMTYLIDDERAFLDITIFSYGVWYFIYCFERVEYQGQIYEYWFVNKDGNDESPFRRTVDFIITSSDSIHGKREILKKSNTYIDGFYINEKLVISLDIDDMWKIYKLEPWLYPLNYSETDLYQYIVWAKDRKENDEDPWRIEDIIWGRKKLGYWKLRKYKKLQTEGGYGINMGGGFTFPSD